MTNRTNTIVKLKLAVIAEFSEFPFLQKQMARDECFVSNNALKYKRQQIADNIADFESAVTEGKDTTADRLTQRIESMEQELNALTDRHAADLSVHEQVVGTKWEASAPKRRPAKRADFSKLKAAVA